MTHDAAYHIEKLKRRYLQRKAIEVSLWSLAFSVVVFAVFYSLGVDAFLFATLSFAASFLLLFFNFKLHAISSNDLLNYINIRYPELQESADLLLRDSSTLTTLEKLQLEKILQQFNSASLQAIKMPHRIPNAALTLVMALMLGFILTAVNLRTKSVNGVKLKESKRKDQLTKEAVPSIEKLGVTVTPPMYTRIKPFSTNDFNVKVPEGSVIKWNIQFSGPITSAALIFSNKDSVGLKNDSSYTAAKRQLNSDIYHIAWKDRKGNAHSSDYYKIDVSKDLAPQISFSDLRQSIDLTIKDKPTIDLKATVSDDYNISDLYIIATVAKGSGESVKFREEKLRFANPKNISGKKINAEKVIDVKKLGLEPGDELYFYAEAIDNRTPSANRSRTETYFITLLDTATQETTVDAGLGVDLMPEYFRSQRQIIMDTEKLLRNKKSISKKEFDFLSNELGYDQKVLRLKYGEFLGEEFESELASTDEVAEEQVETVIQEANEEDENMAEKFGHAHDNENEHNLVEEKKPGHSHEETGHDPEEKEDPLEAFVHAHDDAEEATFFLQSVRAKLKAALTEMWDAELYLRLYQPEKSLPYQYKALRLLKEVSNDSRIYVHKTGFDPPPIKEEKRLTGDLSEIKNSKNNASLQRDVTYKGIRKAIWTIDRSLQSDKVALSAHDKNVLTNAGKEIAKLALENPSKFLPALSLIKELRDEEVQHAEIEKLLTDLQRILYAALPPTEDNVSADNSSSTSLNQSFIENLQKAKND